MKVLELFAGTGSVGKIAKQNGWEVVSLDLKGADINTNILDWDYKKDYKPGDFDIIWASPPCHTFSGLRRTWIGRKLKCHNGEVCSAELLDKDMEEQGLPILRKAEEIIDYFQPKTWFIENPESGKMKKYITDRPHHVVDYCRYADWGYKKPTRIWSNVGEFVPKRCDCKERGLLVNNKNHPVKIGCKGKDRTTLKERYRIPPDLVIDLFKNLAI